MRVLFISNLYPNPYQEHRAPWNRQQLAALAKRHEVRVINPLSWTDELAWRRQKGRLLLASRRSERGGVTADHPRYYYTPRVARGWYGEFYRRSIQRSFRQAVRSFQPDVVLAAWAYPDGWAAVKLAKGCGLPCVLKVHGSDVLLLDDFPSRRAKSAEALCSADHVISVSEDLKRAMTGLGVREEAITVVYDGVDTTRFHPGSRDEACRRLSLPVDEPALLYIGNLLPVKGVDRLIDAAGSLCEKGVAFHLHLIGDGTERASLQNRVQGRGIQERVTFHGAKPHAELPDWFRAANAFCLPSHSEGVPNVLLESAACGTPFVAFDVGGISEIAHLGTSTLTPNDKPERLADDLLPYLTRKRDAQTAGAFRSFDDSAAEVESVLRQTIDTAKGTP